MHLQVMVSLLQESPGPLKTEGLVEVQAEKVVVYNLLGDPRSH